MKLSNIKTVYSPPGSCRTVGSCGSAGVCSRPWPNVERSLAPADWSAPHGCTSLFLLRRHHHRRRLATRTPRSAATQEARRRISARSPKTWWGELECVSRDGGHQSLVLVQQRRQARVRRQQKIWSLVSPSCWSATVPNCWYLVRFFLGLGLTAVSEDLEEKDWACVITRASGGGGGGGGSVSVWEGVYMVGESVSSPYVFFNVKILKVNERINKTTKGGESCSP